MAAAVEIDLSGEDDDADAVTRGGTGDQQPLRNRRSLDLRHAVLTSRTCPGLGGGLMLRLPPSAADHLCAARADRPRGPAPAHRVLGSGSTRATALR
ncbi:hypothetical protein TPA0905_23290 [Streptomyces olivaceus]|nr:hypothetical protein TPA0905_23290 [Streptomyces olivaceus]